MPSASGDKERGNEWVTRIFHCNTIFGGLWPWRLYWLWPDDAEPRLTDHFAVLRWFTSAAYRTLPSTNFSVSVAYCCTRSFPIGLLQQCSVWTSCSPHPASPIFSERCGSANLQNTLPQRSSAFTGFASQNVFHSNWQLWRIDPSTAPLRPIYSRVSPEFPTWHPGDGCGLLPHIVWAFRPLVCLQSASGRFRFLVAPSGTTFLSSSHLRRHSRLSDNESRPFCFPVPIKTLWFVCCYYHSSLLSGPLWSLQ